MTNNGSFKFLQGGGEMGERIRRLDWANTPLGPSKKWSPALRATLAMMVNNRFPMLLWWTKDYISLYNDAYIPILGDKHPNALGLPVKECWNEIWHVLQPLIDKPFKGGAATWMEDIQLIIDRKEYAEETHFVIAYSPIPDTEAANGIGGVLATVNEITDQIISNRTLATLSKISLGIAQAQSEEAVYEKLAGALSENKKDFPFCIIYKIDETGSTASVAGTTGFGKSHTGLIPSNEVDLKNNSADPLNLANVIIANSIVVSEFDQGLKNLPTGEWEVEPKWYVHVPIKTANKQLPQAVLTIALNPYRRFDETYRQFVQLTADHTATGLMNVFALNEEKRRLEALSEIDHAKTAFFSNISHEFRTPLTLMLGPLEEVLRDISITEQQKANISLAFSNSLRLQKLVNNLLDFSRLESGRMQVNYQQTDISALTSQLSSNFQSAIEKSGMQLIINCPPIKQPVFIDQDMWEKIVLNLLSNAFKYTLKGKIIVELKDLGDKFLFRVTDTGIGIPKDQLNKIFERFQRVKGAKGRSIEGTGIGLSMVKELVKILAGTIEVSSVVGVGTTFSITMPIGNENLHENSSDVQDIRNDSPEMSIQGANIRIDNLIDFNNDIDIKIKTTGRPKILLADDNADMRNYLQRLLTGEFDVKAVANGREAIESLQESLPELVLSDVMMPEIDGFELLAHLKNNPTTANIPIILLSARAGEEAIVEGYDKGADDYLIKPFSSRELVSKIRSQFKIKQFRLMAERQLNNLFMRAPAGICVLSGPNLVYELVNPTYQQLLPGRKLLNRSIFEALPEIINQPLQDVLLDVYQNGKPFAANEWRVSLADYEGGPVYDRYFNFNYLPRQNEYGIIDGILVFAFDVTEMVISREELAKTRDSLKMAITGSRLGTFDMDLKMGTMLWDQRCRELFGIGHKDTVTYEKDFVTGLHPEDRERIIKIINNVFIKSISNGDYDVEYRTIGVEDQKVRWVRAMGKAYFDDQDKPFRFIGSVLDITELKQDELRKNDFIGMVSHELKTPLTSLNALIQVLHAKAVKDENKTTINFLDKSVQQVKKMITMINGFLDNSRLESGKIHLNKKVFKLDELIKEIVEEVSLTISNHTITFEPCKPIEINADRDKIGSVITNLLSNAAKYSAIGKPVKVKCKVIGNNVQVNVKDEGMGISQADADRLFERFYRVESNQNKHISGFGIGLYLSAEIIQRHNGKIWVESQIGEGSTFYFTLPINQ